MVVVVSSCSPILAPLVRLLRFVDVGSDVVVVLFIFCQDRIIHMRGCCCCCCWWWWWCLLLLLVPLLLHLLRFKLLM